MKRRGVHSGFLPAYSQDVGRTDMDQISQLYVATDIPRHQPFVLATLLATVLKSQEVLSLLLQPAFIHTVQARV